MVMTIQQKASETKKVVKNVDQNASHSLEHSEDSALKVVDIVNLKQDSETEKSEQSRSDVQTQLIQIKDEVLGRVEIVKQQVQHSQKHLQELSGTLKLELGDLISDLTKLGTDLKIGITQLSSKHKLQITETIKKSTTETLDVWGGKSKS